MAKEPFAAILDLFKSPNNSSVLLVCDACGNKLSVFRKKKPCAECQHIFCTQCLGRSQDKVLRCKSCSILVLRPPRRSDLLSLRVKDLQCYLTRHNVSTRGCVEKSDLVNVLLQYASNPGYQRQHSTSDGRFNATSSGVTSQQQSTTSNVHNGGPTQQATDSGVTSQQDTTQVPGPMQGDSDSSSDTSFELVARPTSMSSHDNVEPSSSSSSNFSDPQIVTGQATIPTQPSTQDTLIEGRTLGELSISQGTAASASAMHPPVSSDFNATATDIICESSPAPTATGSPNVLRFTMSSISSEADLESLSVKQLKELLYRNRVDFHGCCEKAELVERAQRLYRDYHLSRSEIEKLGLDALCKICMDAPIESVMLECGHMATCTDCGRQLSQCPICRQYIVRVVRIFKA